MVESNYFKNLSDGIIVLNDTGTIIEANPSAIALLGLKNDYIGKKYIDIMAMSINGDNDDFHQVIVDSIVEMPRTCKRKVAYNYKDGNAKLFQLTSSLVEDAGKKQLIITISDITETTELMRQRDHSSFAFTSLLCFLSSWVIAYAVWEYLNHPVTAVILSKILIYSSFVLCIYFAVHLKLKPADCGLKYRGIKKAVLTDCLITVIGIIVLIAIKALILRYKSDYPFLCENGVFFDFAKYKWYGHLQYVCSVIAQEFCSRGIVHEQARRVINSKHKEGLAIMLSSLMFAALHVHQGLIYMMGAAALLGILGLVYKKQGTIWGLCIPHFVLGQLIGILGFVAY